MHTGVTVMHCITILSFLVIAVTYSGRFWETGWDALAL